MRRLRRQEALCSDASTQLVARLSAQLRKQLLVDCDLAFGGDGERGHAVMTAK